ncbi:hypothetical protein R3P38DRAFT_856077 [Favolaschia claudopus]|uniref:Uncharacterized protein n=1 Tax=Favolaschia claudopus TaxID=2862362 RepID=A0AAW0BWY2_9AGAR
MQRFIAMVPTCFALSYQSSSLWSGLNCPLNRSTLDRRDIISCFQLALDTYYCRDSRAPLRRPQEAANNLLFFHVERSCPVGNITVLSGPTLGFQSPDLDSLLKRGICLSHLVQGRSAISDVGSLVIPGLEILQIEIQDQPLIFVWLQAFVDRHPHVQVVKFSGYRSVWKLNFNIPFSSQFIGALRKKILGPYC